MNQRKLEPVFSLDLLDIKGFSEFELGKKACVEIGTYHNEMVSSIVGDHFNSAFDLSKEPENYSRQQISPNVKKMEKLFEEQPSKPFQEEKENHFDFSETSTLKQSNRRPLFNLENFLFRLFLEDFSEKDLERLCQQEVYLLTCILKRKFRLQFDSPTPSTEEILNKLACNFQNWESTKRREEKMKMIYKLILKVLKREFEKNNDLKKDEHAQFYNHYFGKFAKLKGQKITSFYDPCTREKKNTRVCVNKTFKCINTKFLRMVFQSEEFQRRFFETLNSPFFNEVFENSLKKKVWKFLYRWRKFYTNGKLSELEKCATAYFQPSQRCKIPWSLAEVNEAKTFFLEYFKIV